MLVWAGPNAKEMGSVAAGDRVEVVVDVHADDEHGGCLLALGADRRQYAVCANDKGKARLRFVGKQSKTLAEADFDPGLFAPGARRRLSLELGESRWVARVDGKVVLDAAAPAQPSGWGVAALAGHAHYLGAHVVSRAAAAAADGDVATR